MKAKNNLETLIENSDFDKLTEVNDELFRIIQFTTMSKYSRKVSNRLPFAKLITGITTKKDEYIFKYNNKEYPFTLLSEKNIQEIDKKNLTDTNKRNEPQILRVLKLACSMDLINPKVIIGNSQFRILDNLISFEENGTEKIIDYSKNIIMKKDDYFELFDFEELNIITKPELYNIFIILSELGNYKLLYYFLLFTKEMFNDLSKNILFEEINVKKKFNHEGINKKNSSVIGRLSDALYFQDSENRNSKYTEEREEIEEFTLNPNKPTQHITYNEAEDKYIFKNKHFGSFDFSLISDAIDYEPVKEDLLSYNRFHKCHPNSHNIIRMLSSRDRENSYIVGGKVKANDLDYNYHSWVEIDDKNIAIDYNHNIIMNRDKYYKLYEAIAIQKTTAIKMEEIKKILINEADLKLYFSNLNYFGEEIYNDMLKNQKVFRKNSTN